MFLAVVVLIGIPMCRNKTGKAIYCTIAGAALFIFAAIRKYTGYDYNLYAQVYMNYLSMDLEEIGADRFEKGIAMPMKLLGDVMHLDYQWMFVGYALIFAAATAYILYKTSDKPYIGLFFFLTLGLYFNSLNFMRQMLASYIVVYGMRFIKTNQLIRYALVVIFASCFHLSALVMIPFYFILKIKMTPITLGAYSVIGIVIFIFSWDVIKFLTQLLPKYHEYGGDVQPASGEMSGSMWPIYTVFFGLCFIFAFLFRKRLLEKNSFNTVWLNCMFFGFYFELISLKHNIVGRLELPFLLAASLILLPRTVECMLEWAKEKFGENRQRVIATSAVGLASVVIVCAGMYGYMIANNYNGVNPYQTIYGDAVWEDPSK